MLAQEVYNNLQPVQYAERMFDKFRELLGFIEEKKGELPESQRMYFDQFAQSLISKYLQKMNECDMGELEERDNNLKNVDEEMASYAEQLRGMIA